MKYKLTSASSWETVVLTATAWGISISVESLLTGVSLHSVDEHGGHLQELLPINMVPEKVQEFIDHLQSFDDQCAHEREKLANAIIKNYKKMKQEAYAANYGLKKEGGEA